MKWIKAAFKYVLLALFILSLGHAFSLATVLTDDRPPVIYYLEDGMTLAQLQDMKEEEEALDDPVAFSSYGRLENQSFENPELGRAMNGPALMLFGNSSLIFHSTGELFADDTAGCLLSTAAAWELFGEPRVSKGAVSWQGKNYIVRGVFEDETPQVVITAETEPAETGLTADEDPIENDFVPESPSGTESMTFSRILIRPEADAARRMETIHVFENRHGFGQNKTDCSVYVRLGTFLLFLIPAMVFVIFLWLAATRIFSLRFQPFWLIVSVLIAVAAFFLFFVICQGRPRIPADLIPNRWSDFNFWGEKISTMLDSIRHMLFAEKTEVELAFFRPVTDIAGYILIAVICFVSAFTLFSGSLFTGHLPVTLFLSVLTEGIVIFLMLQGGPMMAHLRILIYMWPYLIVVCYFFRKNGLLDPKDVDTAN